MTIYRRHYPIKQKLEERCDKTDTCWNWTAAKDSCGYGRIWHNEKNSTAHTVSYSVFRGEIPEGKHVLHSCDNPSCINPEHLWLGTHADNMADKARKKRYPPKGTNGKFMKTIARNA